MVTPFDQTLESAAQKLSQQGHTCLKPPKAQANYAVVLCTQLWYAEPFANGYGEGIHRKPYGKYKQFP